MSNTANTVIGGDVGSTTGTAASSITGLNLVLDVNGTFCK